jgi:hypothetical protein
MRATATGSRRLGARRCSGELGLKAFKEEIVREAIFDAVKAITRFIFEMIIWNVVLFHLGRVAMLIVTLGRYPTRKDCNRSRGRIQVAGMAVLVTLWAAIAVSNNLRG